MSALLALLILAACGEQSAPEPVSAEPESAAGRLVVYTSRQPHLVESLFQQFEVDTGIAIEYISDDAGALIERLAAEAERSPADVLITVDAGNLWQAAERGLLQPLESTILDQRIPAALRDPDGFWYGLSIRARTLVYPPDRVDPEELSTYAALAESKWKGRLCLRTSRKVYNQSLVAVMIERFGEARTEQIVRGWVENLATGPFSSDTRLIEAMAAGQCDVGIVNTYYLGRLQQDNPAYPVRLFWADQAAGGVHVNISGAGITTHASNIAGARTLIE
ncbi:MAG: Fe(3+) ABC transporter substrate-binding protein, partial [Gammaproteobacteria bacterium HGW-Gammaproteobacteria-8]